MQKIITKAYLAFILFSWSICSDIWWNHGISSKKKWIHVWSHLSNWVCLLLLQADQGGVVLDSAFLQVLPQLRHLVQCQSNMSQDVDLCRKLVHCSSINRDIEQARVDVDKKWKILPRSPSSCSVPPGPRWLRWPDTEIIEIWVFTVFFFTIPPHFQNQKWKKN